MSSSTTLNRRARHVFLVIGLTKQGHRSIESWTCVRLNLLWCLSCRWDGFAKFPDLDDKFGNEQGYRPAGPGHNAERGLWRKAGSDHRNLADAKCDERECHD